MLGKEIQLVHPKGDRSWVSIGRTDAEAETPIPPHVKSWLIRKDSDAGRDWRQEEKGMTEDEMAGWHHWLNEPELSELWEMVMDREAWRAAIHGITKSLTHWATELNWTDSRFCVCVCVWGEDDSDGYSLLDYFIQGFVTPFPEQSA